MAHLVLDIETNAIIKPDKLWCVVTQDIDTGEVKRYVGQDLRFLSHDISHRDTIIGHNIIDYDLPCLRRLLPEFSHDPNMVLDTLILSRLYHFNIAGGHSLAMWGKRFKFPKGDFDKFDKFTPEMLTYCERDVALNVKLYQHLMRKLGTCQEDKQEFLAENFQGSDIKPKGEWQKAIKLEHDIAWICQKMTANGFYFDRPAAQCILDEVTQEKEKLDVKLKAVFRPLTKLIREVTPRETKSGTLHSGDFRWMREDIPDLTPFTAGHTFSRFSWVPFNPQSPKQIIERILKYGWTPFEKTDGHANLLRDIRQRRIRLRKVPTPEQMERLREYEVYGWKISEANLSTISDTAPPEAKTLIRRLLLGNRCSVLTSWLEAHNKKTDKIHGNFLPLGCWTHRMAHRNPNMGNIPRPDSEFGEGMRKLWTSGPSLTLVGCDASGIQLRVLAHYVGNEDFTHTVSTGTDANKNDIHHQNAALLGITRTQAKRWIYAWLLGAGPDKLAYLSDTTRSAAIEFADAFMDRYEGLRELKTGRIRTDATHGYFKGLDGRLVISPSEHHMLSGYLQNGEVTIMKKATLKWHASLQSMKIPFWVCNLVHDEWQTRCHEKDAEIVGQVQCASLTVVGQELNMLCPLDGNYKIGRTWYDTH